MTTANSGNHSASKSEQDVREGIKAAGHAAHELKEAAKDVGKGTAEAAQRVAGDKASDLAGALRTVAAKLSEARSEISEPLVASLVGKAADRIQTTAQKAEQSGAKETVAQAMTFARNNPAITIGAAMALGFGLARAGRVASRHLSDHDAPDNMRPMPVEPTRITTGG